MNVSQLHLARQKNSKFIDWYEHTCRSIGARFPEMRAADSYLVAQLSSLLLERLSPTLAKKLLELLPEGAAPEYFGSLLTNAFSDSNTSIGYPDFIHKASYALGVSCQIQSTEYSPTDSTEDLDVRSNKLTDHFLWTIAQEFPPDIKLRLCEELPLELRSRMDLYSARSDESKVG